MTTDQLQSKNQNGKTDERYQIPDEMTSQGANAVPSFQSHPQQSFTDDDYTDQYTKL